MCFVVSIRTYLHRVVVAAQVVMAWGHCLEGSLTGRLGVKPQHYQAAVVGPMSKTPGSPCYRGIALWLTMCSDPLNKEYHCD